MTKLDAMYAYFGKEHVHRCKDCQNLLTGEYRGRRYSKCLRYGVSHSQATDWAQGWKACGAFNRPLNEGEYTVMRRMERKKSSEEEIQGQVSLFAKGERV